MGLCVRYGGVAAAALAGCLGAEAQERPNVIVIVTDDMGCGDIAPMPHLEAVHTPNLERLARQGVTCLQGYASAPMSLPSRVGLLTGCWPAHSGAYKVDAVEGLPENRAVIAEYLKKEGYATAMIGKWHAGGEFLAWRRPENRGFDRTFYWFDSTHDYWNAETGRTLTWGAVGYAPVYDQGRPIERYDTGYLTTDIAQQSLAFIDEHHTSPFFAYICHHCSHRPLQVSRELYDKYADLGYGRNMALTRAMYEVLDDFVGGLLDRLEHYGISDNTLIVFTSDNGGGESDSQLGNTARGGKFTLLEGGLRVPVVIRWPAGIPQDRIYDRAVINLDFLPTILSAAGITPDSLLDGVDLLPYFRGERRGDPHEILCWTTGDNPDYEGEWTPENTPELFGYPFDQGDFAIREGDWKLVSTVNGVGLFNLRDDPAELFDRRADHPAIFERLLAGYSDWARGNVRQRFPDEAIARMKQAQERVRPLKGTYRYSDTFGPTR